MRRIRTIVQALIGASVVTAPAATVTCGDIACNTALRQGGRIDNGLRGTVTTSNPAVPTCTG